MITDTPTCKKTSLVWIKHSLIKAFNLNLTYYIINDLVRIKHNLWFTLNALLYVPGFVQQNRPSSFEKAKLETIQMLDARTKKLSLHAQHNLLVLEAELEKEHCRQLWDESWTKTSIKWVCFGIVWTHMFSVSLIEINCNSRSAFGNVSSNNIQQNALTEHAKPKTHKETKQSCKVRELPSQMVCIRVPQLLMKLWLLYLEARPYVIQKHNMSFAWIMLCLCREPMGMHQW